MVVKFYEAKIHGESVVRHYHIYDTSTVCLPVSVNVVIKAASEFPIIEHSKSVVGVRVWLSSQIQSYCIQKGAIRRSYRVT